MGALFSSPQLRSSEGTANKRGSIFLLVPSLETGGAERQLVALAKGLHQRGATVRVGVFYRRGDLLRDVEAAGIEIVDLAKSDRGDVIGFLSRTVRAVRSARPDIVYSFLGSANLTAAAIRPFFFHPRFVWSIRTSNMDLGKYHWLSRAVHWTERRLATLPDLIVANSRAGADYSVANGFPRRKIIVVPNGIDTGKFRPDARLRAKQRRSFGVAPEHIAVGVLARLDPMKGHSTLLRAARIMAEEGSSVRFICVGAGPELRKLERMADELGIADRVAFVGETDPVAALNAFDIACSSSRSEGFSNSICEAMACGLPCVVTDVGDSAMIVGSAGTVVPPDDPEAMARALLEQARILPKHNPETPRARIVENFSASAMVERTLNAFRERLGFDSGRSLGGS
jgi:glycosyltransferase involved in cell wall biosynthesis